MPEQPKVYHVGTLTYTKAALVTLFVWLLWGDFCFTIMETVIPTILPLKLKALGASNIAVGLIVTTIPMIMASVVNPIASFQSDRYRSRLGRRIPFLLGAAPFLALSLIGMGFSPEIGQWLHARFLAAGGLTQTAVVLAVIGTLMASFQFFNMIGGSIYYYFFNDVVPHAFLARFMALFRIVGAGAGAGYNYFLFKYSISHMREICLGAAVLYLLAFILMCWRIREGEYPPPPDTVDGQPGLAAAVKSYFVECFSHPLYWFFFLANTCYAMTWAMGAFSTLQYQSYGLSLEQIGRVIGVSGLIGTLLLYPAGIISDRYHPLRTLTLATAGLCLVLPLWFTFLFCHFTPAVTFWLFVAVLSINLPLVTLYAAAELPMYMKVLPLERYGQFCSANSMVRSVALMLGGTLAGGFLDLMKACFPDARYGDGFAFRFAPCWTLVCYVLNLVFLLLLVRQWKRHGGLPAYEPPTAGTQRAEPADRVFTP